MSQPLWFASQIVACPWLSIEGAETVPRLTMAGARAEIVLVLVTDELTAPCSSVPRTIPVPLTATCAEHVPFVGQLRRIWLLPKLPLIVPPSMGPRENE
jgi:hypothetical protein